MKDLKSRLKSNIYNLRGWRTSKKIVVFESDDWGSIRTKNSEALRLLVENGIQVKKCHYMMNDSLESDEDLELLFDLLSKYKDHDGNHPKLTANCLMANPDFDAIKKDNFEHYSYESVQSTCSRYPEHSNIVDLWREGNRKSLFIPQLHGREHLNITRWMRDLRKGVSETLMAFEIEMFGISGHLSKVNRGSYLTAFDGEKNEEQIEEIIQSACLLFEDIFGYSSLSFIAPNYTWGETVEKVLFKNKISFIQGSTTQQLPVKFGEKRQIKRHYMGQINKFGQTYLTRNCFFEPSQDPNKDWVGSCIREINTAFRWHKPAIISVHRVNFMGFLNKKNRQNGLDWFEKLIKEILNRWPDVVFMSTDELAKEISKSRQAK